MADSQSTGTDAAAKAASDATADILTRPRGRFSEGARRNADSLGVGLPVLLAWGVSTFTGVTVPIEVASAAAAILGSIGSKIAQAW